MVKIHFPREDCNRYIWYNECWLGPYSTDGQTHESTIDVVPGTDLFAEERGPRHENGVIHEKMDGDLFVSTPNLQLVAAPTTTRPDRCTIQKADRTGTYQVPFGAVGECCGRSGISGDTQITHVALQGSGNSWILYQLDYTFLLNCVIGLTRYIITINSVTSTTASYTQVREYWIGKSMTTSGINWRNKQSLATVQATADRWMKLYSSPYSRTTSTGSSGLYALFQTGAVTELSKNVMRASLAPYFQRNSYLVGEMDYGDLVMDASQQVNATGINTLAFLRDIRRPWELIPKLKNLRSLKVMADNYLTVRYGILPTISDLRSIFGAFKKVIPNRDRFGDENFYASHRVSEVIDKITIEVEQHVKLSVGKEDNAFDALFTGLERVGLFPNLENIWDLIPYTFVIDWFVNVGEFLERVDTHQRLLRFNVSLVTMSRKQTVTATVTPTREEPIHGTLSLVRYHRWVTIKPPAPPLSLQPSHQGANHWLDASALIVQRRK